MQYRQTHAFVEALGALPFLAGLEPLYPGFQSWYINKVVPGVTLGHDVLLLAEDQQQLVGIALGKANKHETKLRCVRVLPQYQNQGVGLRLIDRMLQALECRRPHCTVAEEMLHTYSRALVNRYGFKLASVDKGRYRPGKLEYTFNETAC